MPPVPVEALTGEVARPHRQRSASARVEHLYVHVPFCAHRCGYCDFVTVTGGEALHARYLDALIAELAQRARLVPAPATIFVGGGTPSLLSPPLLRRLLAALPAAAELTVECNPETVSERAGEALAAGGVTRVSLGAQSFRTQLLGTLERRARPDQIRQAAERLRAAGISNLNLDLMFGVPGQSTDDLLADIDDACSLEPDHISYYELEAKPGTRFTHAHGDELERQAERMEAYYELVVEGLRAAGYRWYETANFCRPGRESRHNLGYWQGADYLGAGIGAVSTLGLERRRNRPSLPRYLAALEAGAAPPAEVEQLSAAERAVERVMLGLRLDRPLPLGARELAVLDPGQVERLESAGMLVTGAGTIVLTERGRFVANDVIASILL
jgi:oxygen-independent coproporphyrinogen-3 oxidase